MLTGTENRTCDRKDRANHGTWSVHIGPHQDEQCTSAIVEKYPELHKRTKQARVGQILLSGMLPVFGSRSEPNVQ